MVNILAAMIVFKDLCPGHPSEFNPRHLEVMSHPDYTLGADYIILAVMGLVLG